MKVVILAGGYGTRISEESNNKPKPMVKIGEYPIIWHIMKIYSFYGFNEFIIPLGYKGNEIKNYFLNYLSLNSDLKINLEDNTSEIIKSPKEKWKVTLIDTGINTMTGGRINKIKKYINNERFFLTYGDGLSNINIKKLLNFHIKSNKILTMTNVQLINSYGIAKVKNKIVESFEEKPSSDKTFINGGFFVCEPSIFNYIESSNSIFEQKPLKTLAKKRQIASYAHDGFWHSMDNLKDKLNLENLWHKNPPWKIWT